MLRWHEKKVKEGLGPRRLEVDVISSLGEHLEGEELQEFLRARLGLSKFQTLFLENFV